VKYYVKGFIWGVDYLPEYNLPANTPIIHTIYKENTIPNKKVKI
tara:strand:- start:604 stop:735 length:132 start_codon:yes stop_codon:yes gene_type:complete